MAEVKRLSGSMKLMEGLRQPSDDVDLQPGLIRHISHSRLPIFLTTSVWRNEDKYIKLYVNPSSANWSLPRRESVTKTAAGAVRNVWPNRFRRTLYDEGTVTFTFQTGNLMPGANVDPAVFGRRAFERETYATIPRKSNDPFAEGIDSLRETLDETISSGDTVFSRVKNVRSAPDPLRASEIAANPPVPQGLLDFYRFLEMLNQPMVSWSGENRHFIIYRSRAFPNITLEGYFTGEPVAFTEDASAGNRFQWTSTFQIYRSTPPLWDSNLLRAAYAGSVIADGILSEVIEPTFSLGSAPLRLADLFVEPPFAGPSTNTLMQKGEGKTADTSTGDSPQKLDDVLANRLALTAAPISGYSGTEEPYFNIPFDQTAIYVELMKKVEREINDKSPPPTQKEVDIIFQQELLTALLADVHAMAAYPDLFSKYS